MQLSRFTDYTLRVLFFVAANNDRLVTLSEIAAFYDISVEHLRKVVHALSKSGHLATFRGKHGGIRLAIEPSEINIGQVVAQAEGKEPLIDCSKQGCRLTGACALQSVLDRAQQEFMQVLEEYTLADLTKSPTMRQRLMLKAV